MILTGQIPIHAEEFTLMLKDGTTIPCKTKTMEIKCDIDDRTGDGMASITSPENLSLNYEVKNTHKMVRTLRKLRKDLQIHKPRLPRKVKKARKKAVQAILFFSRISAAAAVAQSELESFKNEMMNFKPGGFISKN